MLSKRLLTSTAASLFLLKHVNISKVRPTQSHYHRIMAEANKEIMIGTHSGIFHCDEVLACYMLQQLPQYKDAKVVRSRDPNILNDCDIVVDVGGTFDSARCLFDHHQKSFEHTLSSLKPELGDQYKIKLSSAGLVYAFFGEEVIRQILNTELHVKMEEDSLKLIYTKVYENLIQEIDAIDNGVPMFDAKPLYRISTDLASRVGRLNKGWNEEEEVNDTTDDRFERAQELVGEELREKIVYYTLDWLPAREYVQDAIDKRFEVHASGEILELERFVPWKEHLFSLEKVNNIEGVPKFAIYKNSERDWRAIAVPNEPKSFVCRNFLHADWRGIREEELRRLCGISDAIFVHTTGFIGGCQSREGALQMATGSLNPKPEDGK